MADTIRSTDDLLNASTGLFKDNTAGDISAQDLRDFVLSAYRPPSVPFCGYLSLDPTNRIKLPASITPTSTDTAADTCTFSAGHNFSTGTIVIPGATAGGLTGNTAYYLNCPNDTTFSFHATAADAHAGTNKVNLTASIGSLNYAGITNTTIYLHPVCGNGLGLYDGTSWKLHNVPASISLALSGLTADTNYDVYVYDASGTPTLELTAWTDNTTRATELAWQDGVLVKSGAATRRYVGTIRAINATTTENSHLKRFVHNYYNQRMLNAMKFAGSSSHTYNASSWRNYNNSATATLIQFVLGTAPSIFIQCGLVVMYTTSVTDQRARQGVFLGGLSGSIAYYSSDQTVLSSIGTYFYLNAFTRAPVQAGYYEGIVQQVAYANSATYDWGRAEVIYLG